MGPFLYIFTDLSVYVAANVGQENESLIRVMDGVGCIATGSIQTTGSGVIFLGSNGHVYMANGNKVVSISGGRVQRQIRLDQCSRGRVTSVYQSTNRRYLLMFADHETRGVSTERNTEGFSLPSLTNHERRVGNRWYEYRVGNDAWFPWEFAVKCPKYDPYSPEATQSGDPGGKAKGRYEPRKPVYDENGQLVNHPTELLDAVVIRDGNGAEHIHGIYRNPYNQKEVTRFFLEGISDNDQDVVCGWISSPIAMYDTISSRPRRVWVITEEVSNKNMSIDGVSDDDRLTQATDVLLTDRSKRWLEEEWRYGVSRRWGDEARWQGQVDVTYRGKRPLKRAVGIRDGEQARNQLVQVGEPRQKVTYPATGKHFSVWIEVSCNDYSGRDLHGEPSGQEGQHNLGNAYLYGAQVELLPKSRRAE